MPQLQKPLQGLARFLGLQSQGSLQVNWTPNMVPVFEMADWIGPDLYDQIANSGIAADGTLNAVTVPDGERWQLLGAGVMVTPPLAVAQTDSYLRVLRYGFADGAVLSTQRPTNNQFMHNSTAGSRYESGYAIYPPRLFLNSGDRLEVRLQRSTTGVGTYEVRCWWQYRNLTL